MERENFVFRHELKYLINEGDAQLIRQRLAPVMQQDKHAVGGSYQIRSLYFDDYQNTNYADKLAGVRTRKKYRVRIYNLQEDVIRLECKVKQGTYISKQAAALSRRELELLREGRYEFLIKREEAVCRKFYYECMCQVLRPQLYVDYVREPYVLEAGDVRVTFDRNLSGSSPGFPMFDGRIPEVYALEPGKLVMEVKFTEFLPQLVRNLLPARGLEYVAVSKYTLCCDAIFPLLGKIVKV